jgi:hypothetical protein
MEMKKAPEPFVMVFAIPCTDEGEIRRQFSRFEREFSPSRIEICIDRGPRRAGEMSRLTRG